MKICLISNLYEPYTRGGAEKIAKLMAEALSRRHEVSVISTTPEKKAATEIVGNIKIHRFRPVNLFYCLNDYKHSIPVRLLWHFLDIFNVFSARRVFKILKAEKPDAVICHNLKGLGYLIPRQIKKLKINYVQVLHDVQYAVPSGLILKGEENSFVTNGFLTKWYAKICRFLIKPEVVVSPSKWLLEFYEKKDFFQNSKKVIIRNPAKKVENVNKPERIDLNNLLFVGQVEKHKGIDFLLETIKSFPEVKLTVAGEGTRLSQLKNRYQTKKNIIFLGKLMGKGLQAVYAQNAYVVVPSLCYENSPTVIYESFAAGRPVIAADIGGTAELVDDGQTGYVFDAGNAKHLREKIEIAIKNSQYAAMSQNCISKIEEFTMEKYLEKLLDILKK